MTRVMLICLGFLALLGWAVALAVCGCKSGASKLNEPQAVTGPGAAKTPEQKMNYIKSVQEGKAAPPPGAGK